MTRGVCDTVLGQSEGVVGSDRDLLDPMRQVELGRLVSFDLNVFALSQLALVIETPSVDLASRPRRNPLPCRRQWMRLRGTLRYGAFKGAVRFGKFM